jgi:hypothetical protein
LIGQLVHALLELVEAHRLLIPHLPLPIHVCNIAPIALGELGYVKEALGYFHEEVDVILLRQSALDGGSVAILVVHTLASLPQFEAHKIGPGVLAKLPLCLSPVLDGGMRHK